MHILFDKKSGSTKTGLSLFSEIAKMLAGDLMSDSAVLHAKELLN